MLWLTPIMTLNMFGESKNFSTMNRFRILAVSSVHPPQCQEAAQLHCSTIHMKSSAISIHKVALAKVHVLRNSSQFSRYFPNPYANPENTRKDLERPIPIYLENSHVAQNHQSSCITRTTSASTYVLHVDYAAS